LNGWNNKFQSIYHIKSSETNLLSSSSSRLFLAAVSYSNDQSNLPLNIKNNYIITNNINDDNNNINDSSLSTISSIIATTTTTTTDIVSRTTVSCNTFKKICNSFNQNEFLSKKWVLPFIIFLISTLSLHLPSVLAAGMNDIISSSSSSVATDLTTLDLTDNSNGGFIQSFLIIFISEIGDKTFFIAGLLAAKYGRLISFTGSLSALAIMTIISTVLGQIFHAIPTSITQGNNISSIPIK